MPDDNNKGRTKKTKQLPITIRFAPLLKVLNLFSGEFISFFKGGEGEEFAGLRPYQAGDDVGRIHWPSLAKTGSLYVTEKISPKTLTCLVAVDISSSTTFGSKIKIVEMFLSIMIAAIVWRGNNFLGFLGFSDEIEQYCRPEAGKRRFFEMQTWFRALTRTERKKTNIADALSFVNSKIRPNTLVFFISDFLSDQNFSQELKAAVQKFDFIPVIIRDFREFDFPVGFRISLEDLEKKGDQNLELTSENVQKLRAFGEQRTAELISLFRRCDVEPIFLNSPDEIAMITTLSQWFARRARRKKK